MTAERPRTGARVPVTCPSCHRQFRPRPRPSARVAAFSGPRGVKRSEHAPTRMQRLVRLWNPTGPAGRQTHKTARIALAQCPLCGRIADAPLGSRGPHSLPTCTGRGTGRFESGVSA